MKDKDIKELGPQGDTTFGELFEKMNDVSKENGAVGHAFGGVFDYIHVYPCGCRVPCVVVIASGASLAMRVGDTARGLLTNESSENDRLISEGGDSVQRMRMLLGIVAEARG